MYNICDINKIKNINSKKNFEYVLQAYYSKNYKASILLLYNLLVNDLYEKLKLMEEKNYLNCKNELDCIENILKDGDVKKYSLVEEKIFEVYKKKKILNQSTIDLLCFFKEVRNKCAHPFFFKESEYSPIAEEVYLFIIKIYNEILIIDAFLKEPYQVMKEDIENFNFPDIRDNLLGASSIEEDISKVRKYFEAKYFRYMTENNFQKLFKTLIDLTISKKSDEIQQNQYKNFLILIAMLEYLQSYGKSSILKNVYSWSKLRSEVIYDDNKDPFSDEWIALSCLCKILLYNQSFIEEVKNSNETIYNKINTSIYQKGYLFIKFWQLFDCDINIAIKKFNENSPSYNFREILNKYYMLFEKDVLIKIMENMIKQVPTFDGYDIANSSLNTLIDIIKHKRGIIQQDDLERIFELINENRQFYDKNRSNRDNQLQDITNLGYNLSAYNNLLI